MIINLYLTLMKQFILFLIMSLSICNARAQYMIEPEKGYTNDIGNIVAMLDDLKSRVTGIVSNLSQEQTDFLLDEDSNRIGAIILHLAATEVYYQKFTFEKRSLNEEESAQWDVAQQLGDTARTKLKGKPISYYLDLWDDVRKETKRLLKTKDDTWFKSKSKNMNNHWAWYHVMEHQANHMGQIVMISKRAKKS